MDYEKQSRCSAYRGVTAHAVSLPRGLHLHTRHNGHDRRPINETDPWSIGN